MSIKIMSQIWDRGPSAQSDRFVLLALADYANDDGECWPAISSIQKKVCMSERGVQTVIRRLESEGWLEIETGNGRKGCNQYTIKNPAGDAPRRRCTPQMDAETPRMDVKNPAGDAPEPSRTIKEPSVRSARDALLSVLSPDVADDFIHHRKAKRALLTPRAGDLIAKKLDGHPDPDGVVNNSIANGWTGVFPEKFQPKRNGGVSDGAASGRAQRAAERYADRHGARGVDRREDRGSSQPLLSAGDPDGSPRGSN